MGEVTETPTLSTGEEGTDLGSLLTDPDLTLPGIVLPETEATVPETVETQATETDVAEVTEETSAATQVPATPLIPAGIDTTRLCGGVLLAMLLAMLLAVIVASIFRKRKKTASKADEVSVLDITVAAEPAIHSPVYAAVVHAQGARNDQQDAYGVFNTPDPVTYAQQGMMAVVADGMGGLTNGSVVSNLLVQTFQQGFQSGGAYMHPEDLLLDLAIRANAQVNQMLRATEPSGSTLVAAILRSGYLHFLSVGDSHLYLYRNGALLQLNREHVYREELAVRAINRYLPPAQIRSDPQAGSLTSYFGIGVIPAIDRSNGGIKLVSGDRIILCSDGVYGTLTQEQMEQALCQPLKEAANRIGGMIEAAAMQHQDNYTAVILEYRN